MLWFLYGTSFANLRILKSDNITMLAAHYHAYHMKTVPE